MATRPTHRPQPRLAVEALDDRSVPAFLAPIAYPAGAGPAAVLAADFDNDTVPDLAVANSGPGTISFLRGNADGTFEPATTFATGAGPAALAAGDFDDDGHLDLVTANWGDVTLLKGTGTGSFAAPVAIAVDGDPRSVAVGDFNGDGTLDLGVTSSLYVFDGWGYYGPYFHYEGKANVLLGTGTGTFDRRTTTIGIGDYTGTVVGDVNGDGADDFVSLHRDGGTVAVQLGDGDGDLGAAAVSASGGYSYSVAAGDLDGDGDLDLVTTQPWAQTASVLIGTGQGTFGGTRTFAVGATPVSPVLADVNTDGDLDVVVANGSGTDVRVLLGRGDGSLSPAVASAVGSTTAAVAVGDFDADGWPDAAVTQAGTGTAAVLLNDQAWPAADAPSVRIDDATVTEGNTGTRSVTFTVTLSAAATEPIAVQFATADGTAAAGADYTATSGEVVFAAGETKKTVVVPVLGDRSAEPSETFVVSLATADAFITRGAAAGTVFDDEPMVFIGHAAVTEGNAGTRVAKFKVKLSFAYDEPVTVPYSTANDSAAAGTDFQAAAGTVTFAPGQKARSVSVAVVGDRVPEFTEGFFVNLGATPNAAIAEGQGIGTIRDNEPRLTINSVSKLEGDGGTRRFVFTVRLSAAYGQAVTVNYLTADNTATAGSDYGAKSGTLRFAPGERTKTITIAVYGSFAAEPDEYFSVNLSGQSANAALDLWQGWGTIWNDD